MKKLLIILSCFTLAFLGISTSASSAFASNETSSIENNIQEVFNYNSSEKKEIREELQQEISDIDKTMLDISNLDVTDNEISIESNIPSYDMRTKLEIKPGENTALYSVLYEENNNLVKKEYALNIDVTDEEDFSIEFIDNQTGETTIYDSSVATASAIPYIAYIVGSQVVRLAIKGVAKKTVQVSVNLGKVLKHNSRGVLFEGSSSKGWKHIYDGHVLGKGAKKGDTLFPKNLSQTQIKNIIMESLEKGVYKGENKITGYKSYVYSLNKYGIANMKVIVDRDGIIVTAYPMSGKSVITVK